MPGKKITAKDYDKRTKKMPAEKWIKEYFEPEEKHKEERLKGILEAVSPKKGEKILEVGCGMGPLLFHIGKSGAKCFGADYSMESLKTGKKIFRKIGRQNAESFFACSDAIKLPFKSGSFDKILNADFLEHIYPQEKNAVTREMERVLKPKGSIVSYTPNRTRLRIDYFIKKIAFAARGKRLGWQKSDKRTVLFDTELHVGLSNARELKEVFEKNGLKVKKTIFIGCSFPLLNRVFRNAKIMPGVFGAYILMIAKKG